MSKLGGRGYKTIPVKSFIWDGKNNSNIVQQMFKNIVNSTIVVLKYHESLKNSFKKFAISKIVLKTKVQNSNFII